MLTVIFRNTPPCRSGSTDSAQSNVRNGRNQKFVFIGNVELVETPQGQIPSFVWAYRIQDELSDYRRVYFSPLQGFHKFLPCSAEGKLSLGNHCAARQGHHFAYHKVPCRPNVMDGIAQDEGNVLWNRLMRRIKSQIFSSGLRTFLDIEGTGMSTEI